jgi:hypothetical protein
MKYLLIGILVALIIAGLYVAALAFMALNNGSIGEAATYSLVAILIGCGLDITETKLINGDL